MNIYSCFWRPRIPSANECSLTLAIEFFGAPSFIRTNSFSKWMTKVSIRANDHAYGEWTTFYSEKENSTNWRKEKLHIKWYSCLCVCLCDHYALFNHFAVRLKNREFSWNNLHFKMIISHAATKWMYGFRMKWWWWIYEMHFPFAKKEKTEKKI